MISRREVPAHARTAKHEADTDPERPSCDPRTTADWDFTNAPVMVGRQYPRMKK